ncbi:hypothetical protein DNK74_16865 [Klebsiella pneumoniae]|nr:hypothetical protein DNK74_16865 [Klebsiella pneumoniae]
MRESSAGSPLCYLRLQRTLRFRIIFCVRSLMAQGASGVRRKRPPDGSLSSRERARVRRSIAGKSFMLSVASA